MKDENDMTIALINVDTSNLQVRCRDTEFEDAGANTGIPGPWSEWEPVVLSTTDTAQALLELAVVGYLNDPQDPSENPSLLVSFSPRNPDGSPIRTVDNEYQLVKTN